MDKARLKEILDKHLKWLRNEDGGFRADLSYDNLSGADLSCANLSGADLSCANLSRADLSCADLSCANLSGADLSCANLSRADLSCANLSYANLYCADLSCANLYCVKIPLELVNKFYPLACPEFGSFIGWKKCRENKIVKLLILEDAKRSSAFGRKCRCSAARVLSVEWVDGTPAGIEAQSGRVNSFIYRIGEIVSVDDFDEDRRNECSTGIHFFITRQEAVDYEL